MSERHASPHGPGAFDERLEALDLSLFAAIESQTSLLDRRSLLACQAALRSRVRGHYVYLEIGSHLGGTLQPHLLDHRCSKIVSIDLRCSSQPDARGPAFEYRDNSTRRMLDNLRRLAPQSLDKISCLKADTPGLDPRSIAHSPHLCLIDGEHTDGAALADFRFCRQVLATPGVIVFHDAFIIYNALARAIEELRTDRIDFRAYVLPESLFVIELGDLGLHRDPVITELLVDNHVGYLFALRANDHFRRFFNRPLFGFLRRCKALVTGRRR